MLEVLIFSHQNRLTLNCLAQIIAYGIPPSLAQGQTDPVLHSLELAVWYGLGAMIQCGGEYSAFTSILTDVYERVKNLPSPPSLETLRQAIQPDTTAHLIEEVRGMNRPPSELTKEAKELATLQDEIINQRTITARLRKKLDDSASKHATELAAYKERLQDLEARICHQTPRDRHLKSPDHLASVALSRPSNDMGMFTHFCFVAFVDC